ncbi:D-2-hydroxyglutarate dehydrogenase, mitochondrial [Folsomia candida]|uniref:D-2-hydroxyglutarate dehydrogenase, mitochondrial n=1 Tax=Folsomia candida TaxID=158441 RepID=A0A226DZA8_FOLCA|nr:D-2-hydroxyglutarate dehydrogenase, mitochondrial [Folsomia candida]
MASKQFFKTLRLIPQKYSNDTRGLHSCSYRYVVNSNYQQCTFLTARQSKSKIVSALHPSKAYYGTQPSSSKITRGPYSRLEAVDIAVFTGILGKARVINGAEDDLDGFNVDWLKSVRGNAQIVLKPNTTEEVSQIMQHCHSRNLAVVPQGGNTGLNGGCIAIFDEVVISTSLMNQVINLDELTGVLTCQSGCVLYTLDEHVKERGFVMPLDLGAKESCQIGGNLSTNAGGLRVLRYGSLHATVLGIEAVLADGTILDCMSTMKKDNTGYDLKHLFIGSEGTLGILTKVAIQCPIKPNSINLAFLGLDSYSKVLETYQKARNDLGEILSACEYIDNETMKCAEENMNLKAPISSYPYYMMIETAGSNAVHDEDKLNSFLEDSMKLNLVTDGTAIWSTREKLADAMLKDGYFLIFDFSVPLEIFEKFVQDTRAYLGASVKRVTGFGHLGDGNIHLNITMEKFNPDVLAKVEPFVYQWVANHKGSISAEHGIGSKKRHLIHHSKSGESIKIMKQIKKLLDPKNIMNPYKVLPE